MTMPEMKIYLDDERKAPTGWILTKSAKSTIELLALGCVTHLSLDHDLGEDDVGTGYDVLLWIEREASLNGFKPPVIHLHTANTSARKKMELAVEKINMLSNR